MSDCRVARMPDVIDLSPSYREKSTRIPLAQWEACTCRPMPLLDPTMTANMCSEPMLLRCVGSQLSSGVCRRGHRQTEKGPLT